MSRNTKIILAIVGMLVVLCLCIGGGIIAVGGWFATQGIAAQPADVSQTAAKIADFQPPAGFQPDYGSSILGMVMVAYTDGSRGRLFIVQMPASAYGNIQPEDTERQMRKIWQGRGFTQAAEMDFQIVGRETGVVRGQPVVLTISEGRNAGGESYRQISTAFQGKSGIVWLMIGLPASEWDQAGIDAFLRSIR
jgi:hypothetical protein